MEPDMYRDMQDANWFKDKVRASTSYAQNLYAAMCNMQWQKIDVIPILTDEYWTVTWRGAGGIVSNLRTQGDYLDWYCSGMGGIAALPEDIDNEDALEEAMAKKKYVSEGTVTDEIQADLEKLGWRPVPYQDD
jgi:hypothetical protein